MKTNEAPEKLYFTSNENGTHYYTEGIPFEREYIEYTRTDAFIKKTVEYIANNMRCGGYAVQTRVKFIKDLKNYLKENKL